MRKKLKKVLKPTTQRININNAYIYSYIIKKTLNQHIKDKSLDLKLAIKNKILHRERKQKLQRKKEIKILIFII